MITLNRKKAILQAGTSPKTLVVDFDKIPPEMAEARRWIGWRWDRRGQPGKERWTKVPVSLKTGKPIDAANIGQDHMTLAEFSTIKQCPNISGLGFTLDDGFAGIDLDNCRDPETGELAGWAQEIIKEMGSYTEVSPTGTGVKVFGLASSDDWPDKWNRKNFQAGEVEVYTTGRYFCVTGQHVEGTPTELRPLASGLAKLATRFKPDASSSVRRETPEPSGWEVPNPGRPGEWQNLSQLLAFTDRQSNGPKIRRLAEGDTADYGGDRSRADAALCTHLAFYLGKDAARMDQFFRESGLMRPKWDEKHASDGRTYGQITIDKAIETTTNVFGDRTSPGSTSNFTSRDTTPPLESRERPVAPHESAFYGLAGDYIRGICEETEADPVGVLVQLLVAFGNLIGREPRMLIDSVWHRTNLFAVVVGSTGSGRKGASWKVSQRFYTKSEILNGIDERWQDDRIKSGLSSSEGLVYQMRDPNEKQGDLGEADKRLLVIEEEFSGVLANFRREGNTLSQRLREAWDSPKVMSPLTKTDFTKATHPHVSIIGHITPSDLMKSLTTTEVANGLANRFMFVYVKSERDLPFGGNLRDEMLIVLQGRLSHAAGFAQQVGQLDWHQSARPLWEAVYPILKQDRVGIVNELAARSAPMILRLAMIYALLDCSRTIRPVHLMAAIALWDYSERCLVYLFADKTGDDLADSIDELLKANPEGISRTELSNALGRHVPSSKMTTALQLLEKYGRARRDRRPSEGRHPEMWHRLAKSAERSRLLEVALEVMEGLPREVARECGQPFKPPVLPCPEVSEPCFSTSASPTKPPPPPTPPSPEAVFIVNMLRKGPRPVKEIETEAKKAGLGSLAKAMNKELRLVRTQRGACYFVDLPPSTDLSRFPEMVKTEATLVDDVPEPEEPPSSVHPGDEEPKPKRPKRASKLKKS
jgi:hypothetical protein